jgi:CoA:oxalate CoA-transferase
LDFTRILSGPFATVLLADLGANVIKVEAPQGDEYRRIGPFNDGQSALFMWMNRGKRSIALDLKDEIDLKVALNLALEADVVVENFTPGVAERLGIGCQRLMSANPGLIYCSLSGFGQTGPWAARPAYDIVVQALSGLMQVTGEALGPPTMVGEPIADLTAGLYASWAILAALVDRQRTGTGRLVDVAMFDSLLSFLPTSQCRKLFAGIEPMRVGNRHPLSTPFGAYRAKDGHLVIAVLSNEQFQRLCHVMGAPDLAKDPRFASDESRTRHESDIRAIIEEWSSSRSVRAALDALSEAGVPAAPIQGVGQALASEQTQARALLAVAEDPRLGPIALGQQPIRFAGIDRGRTAPAPALNQHGAHIRQYAWTLQP